MARFAVATGVFLSTVTVAILLIIDPPSGPGYSLVGNDCAGQTPGMALDDPTQYHRIAPGPTDVTHLLVDNVSAMP